MVVISGASAQLLIVSGWDLGLGVCIALAYARASAMESRWSVDGANYRPAFTFCSSFLTIGEFGFCLARD